MKSSTVFHYLESGSSRHALLYAHSLMIFAEGGLDSVLDVAAADGVVCNAFNGRNKPVYQ
jgi:hypothetical protein